MSMNPRNSFERLLAALQGAALDDARWPGASRLIDEACGATGSSFVVGDGAGDGGPAAEHMVPVTLPFEHPFRGPGAIYDLLGNFAVKGGLLWVVLGEQGGRGIETGCGAVG